MMHVRDLHTPMQALVYSINSCLSQSASSLLSYQLINRPKMTYGHLQCWLANLWK